MSTGDHDYHHTLWRGWCFQERLLSRRVLHFTHREMVWGCRLGWQCECSPLGRADDSDSSLQRSYRFQLATKPV